MADRVWLKQYQFKPGQSGNPGGRPKNTLKEYAREYLQNMTEEERAEYLNGLDRDLIWRMAEGQPKQDVDANVEVTKKIIGIDE